MTLKLFILAHSRSDSMMIDNNSEIVFLMIVAAFQLHIWPVKVLPRDVLQQWAIKVQSLMLLTKLWQLY